MSAGSATVGGTSARRCGGGSAVGAEGFVFVYHAAQLFTSAQSLGNQIAIFDLSQILAGKSRFHPMDGFLKFAIRVRLYRSVQMRPLHDAAIQPRLNLAKAKFAVAIYGL